MIDMEKKNKQEYEFPEVMIFDITSESVFLESSWGNGSIGEDDENNLYNF